MPVIPVSSGVTYPTVQNIIDAVSQDIRQLLAASGADATILIDYCNRVHQEILRKTRWVFLKSGTLTFNTIAGTSSYYVGTGSTPAGSTSVSLNLADIYTIDERSVLDRTNFRQLSRIGTQPLGAYWSSNGYPIVYRNDSSSPYVIDIYPPPAAVYSIEFRYFKTRTLLSTSGQALQIPDDYRGVVIAGVNSLACVYLKLFTDAQFWKAEYQNGVQDMVRDKFQFPKGTGDFVNPDSTSQRSPIIVNVNN